jgi:hypothetical protein
MRKTLIVSIVCFAILAVAALLWPTASYDLNRVHPSLRQLATPYQSVSTGEYLDGGSIGVVIVDRDGRRLLLALPVSYEGGRKYRKLFVGATHTSKTGAVEVAFSDDTRRMLISVMEDHRSSPGDSDSALVSLRGAPRDHARLWSHVAVSLWEKITK